MRLLIWPIDGNHEGDIPSCRISDDSMHRPPVKPTEDEATRTAFGVGIIFDNFSIEYDARPNIVRVEVISSRFISSVEADNSILAFDGMLHLLKIHVFPP